MEYRFGMGAVARNDASDFVLRICACLRIDNRASGKAMIVVPIDKKYFGTVCRRQKCGKYALLDERQWELAIEWSYLRFQPVRKSQKVEILPEHDSVCCRR
ncbi:MAG: hypothetical protein FD138_2406 [Planctomycetota bacterium]|nr:MAG: hypothetical protein FD138_2406 [Planctomycetota bacterium]